MVPVSIHWSRKWHFHGCRWLPCTKLNFSSLYTKQSFKGGGTARSMPLRIIRSRRVDAAAGCLCSALLKPRRRAKAAKMTFRQKWEYLEESQGSAKDCTKKSLFSDCSRCVSRNGHFSRCCKICFVDDITEQTELVRMKDQGCIVQA